MSSLLGHTSMNAWINEILWYNSTARLPDTNTHLSINEMMEPGGQAFSESNWLFRITWRITSQQDRLVVKQSSLIRRKKNRWCTNKQYYALYRQILNCKNVSILNKWTFMLQLKWRQGQGFYTTPTRLFDGVPETNIYPLYCRIL